MLLNQAASYLQDSLGAALHLEGAWEGGAQLPRHSTEHYRIRKASLAGREVLLMSSKEDAPALQALLKQRALIQRVAGVPLIWVGDTLTAYARKELVTQRVPFVIPFKHVYLPPLGIEFQERAFSSKRDANQKLHVATQVFLMNALLGNLPEALNPKAIAKQLGYSLMTITRIKDELTEHGWLDIQAYQSKRQWSLNLQGAELWAAMKPYLQNPVRKRFWLRNPPAALLQLPLAGLSALAEQTRLSEPPNTVRAIGELEWRKVQKGLPGGEMLPEPMEGALELEIWRYAPMRTLRQQGGDVCVDPYSLFLSLEGMDDDRVHIALSEIGLNYPSLN